MIKTGQKNYNFLNISKQQQQQKKKKKKKKKNQKFVLENRSLIQKVFFCILAG